MLLEESKYSRKLTEDMIENALGYSAFVYRYFRILGRILYKMIGKLYNAFFNIHTYLHIKFNSESHTTYKVRVGRWSNTMYFVKYAPDQCLHSTRFVRATTASTCLNARFLVKIALRCRALATIHRYICR